MSRAHDQSEYCDKMSTAMHKKNHKNVCCFVAMQCLHSDRVYSVVHLWVSCLFEMSFYFDGAHDSARVSVICYVLLLNEPQCLRFC